MTTHALPEILDAVAAELARLADATERMHDLVCAEPQGEARRDAAHIRAVQSVDHTRQILAELSGFLANMAADAPVDWRLPLGGPLAALRLAELRHRLVPGGSTGVREPASSGECELF